MSDTDHTLRAVPLLDELAADPGKAGELPVAVVEALLTRCHTLEGALFARLLAARTSGPPAVSEEDRLLTAKEAAERLATSEDWLYRHVKKLPFTVRNGRQLRFSAKGIARYIREQEGV